MIFTYSYLGGIGSALTSVSANFIPFECSFTYFEVQSMPIPTESDAVYSFAGAQLKEQSALLKQPTVDRG